MKLLLAVDGSERFCSLPPVRPDRDGNTRPRRPLRRAAWLRVAPGAGENIASGDLNQIPESVLFASQT